MDEAYELARQEYLNYCRALADASAAPRPNYSVPGGATLDFGGYIQWLQRARDAARKSMIDASGGYVLNEWIR